MSLSLSLSLSLGSSETNKAQKQRATPSRQLLTTDGTLFTREMAVMMKTAEEDHAETKRQNSIRAARRKVYKLLLIEQTGRKTAPKHKLVVLFIDPVAYHASLLDPEDEEQRANQEIRDLLEADDNDESGVDSNESIDLESD